MLNQCQLLDVCLLLLNGLLLLLHSLFELTVAILYRSDLFIEVINCFGLSMKAMTQLIHLPLLMIGKLPNMIASTSNLLQLGKNPGVLSRQLMVNITQTNLFGLVVHKLVLQFINNTIQL